jgi:hypothetical protein
MPTIVKSWRDAGDTPCRKTTKERQNFDPSTPPTSAEHLHFMLNGENRRAPGLQVARTQMALGDPDKVSLAVHGTPTDNLGQSILAPWINRPTPGEKGETE